MSHFPADHAVCLTREKGMRAFSGTTFGANSTRNFTLAGQCGVPKGATAYILNLTAIPKNLLQGLTVWASGAAQPNLFTLLSFDGQTAANMAIVPAGMGASADTISVFVTDAADLVADISGYFTTALNNPLILRVLPTPCRAVDTRINQSGGTLPVNTVVSFAIAGSCGVPNTAVAYSINVTAVPKGNLQYLTVSPAIDKTKLPPQISTLNSPDRRIIANAVIVAGDGKGNIAMFAAAPLGVTTTGPLTDVIIDVNGYFAPLGS